MEDFEEFEREAIAELRRLFPDLSEEELAEISGALSFEDLLALEHELEAIRDEVAEFSADLFKSAEERVMEREQDFRRAQRRLSDRARGRGPHLHPRCRERPEPHRAERSARRHAERDAGRELDRLSVNGQDQEFTLSCLANGPTVDVVFLIDITGSMSNVIDSVRDSVVDFIDIIESSGLRGTVERGDLPGHRRRESNLPRAGSGERLRAQPVLRARVASTTPTPSTTCVASSIASRPTAARTPRKTSRARSTSRATTSSATRRTARRTSSATAMTTPPERSRFRASRAIARSSWR